MTAVLPAVAPPPPPENPDAVDRVVVEVAPERVAYRRRYRRRLVLGSLPVVVVALLLAVKLLSLPLFAGVAQVTYDTGSYNGTVASSDGLGPLNVLEPWVRYFDRGTALGRIGVLVDSRTDLEKALALVPPSNVPAACRVRTDLLLVVEQQGDSAVLDQDYSAAEEFYAHALALYNAAPKGCFSTPNSPKTPATKQPLQQAHGRLEQKQKQAQQQAGGSSGSNPGGTGGKNGQGGSQSDQSGSSQNPLDRLQKQDAQAQRQQEQQNDRNREFQKSPQPSTSKPW